MSLIIKGMKMPQKEGDYDARLHVNRDGTALLFLYGECGGHEAKELPPHGRLIDADVFEKENIYYWGRDFIGAKDETCLCELIEAAPTIIEAEEEENE